MDPEDEAIEVEIEVDSMKQSYKTVVDLLSEMKN